MPDNNNIGHLETRVGNLEQSVASLNTAVTGISGQLNNISNKLDSKTQTNWPVIIGFISVGIGVLGYIGNLTFKPYEAELVRIERDISRLEMTVVPRSEHTEKWRQQERIGDEMRKRLEKIEERFVKK